MFRTRGRKIVRDVLARKGRTALVSLAIFIGVTGTIAMFSMSDILITRLKADVKPEELSMVQVSVVQKEGSEPDNLAYAQALSDYPGVTALQIGYEEYPVSFKASEDQAKFEDGYVQSYLVLNDEGTALLNAPFEAEPTIEPFRLLEGGRWPEVGANEVAIERRTADKYGLKVGDQIYIRILSPSRIAERNGAAGTVEAWTISGIVFDPYAFAPNVSIYPRFEDGQYMIGLTGLNDFWFRFTDYAVAEHQADGLVEYIARNTAYSPAFVESQDPAENQLVTNAELFANLMSILALISLVVTGFLVVNVISSIVTEQKRQIGVMKSLGATRFDNFLIYSGIAFAYGVIGVIPGVILGIPAGYGAAKALAPQLNTIVEGFQVSPPSIILGVIVGLIVPVVASLLPVFNGTRVKILDAMTDLGIGGSYGSGVLARIIGVLPLPVTVRQGLSNVSVKKGRLVFTVLTLAIAVGAFMGIFALFESLTSGINLFFDSWNIDFGIFPSEPRDPQQMISVLESSYGDQIKSIQPGFMQQIEFEGYTPRVTTGGPPGIFAYGYDITAEDPAFLFTLSKGEKLTAENAADGIVLSSLLASNMNKEVGDTVVLKVPGNVKEFKVVGIADFPIEQAWAAWDVLALLRDSTIDTITSDSLIPANAIPAEARGFIKYATVAAVDGYSNPAAAGALPGTLVIGFTSSVSQFLQFEDGAFASADQPGVMISSAMAEQGGYQVGDTLTLSSLVSGGLKDQAYPIVGIFIAPVIFEQNAMVPPDFIGMVWQEATALDGAVVERTALPGGYFISLKDSSPTADEVEELLEASKETYVNQGIGTIGFNFVELTQMISDAFVTIQAILSAVAGLIALVGALGLLTTLSMSVFERQKEIGVMRSIGAGSSTVAIQFLTEGLVVGVVAWLVGIPLMVGIQYLLLDITGFNDTFPFEFSPMAVVVGLIGMLIITTIASLWPSLSAARKTVSDILRYQ